MKKSSYHQWEIRRDGVFFPSLPTTKRLPAGVYEIRNLQGVGFHMLKIKVETEGLVEIPVPEIQAILTDIKLFWEKRDMYIQNNLIYKRGILLFGAPGVGKSYVIHQLMEHVINERDGIVINLSSAVCIENYVEHAAYYLRAIEPERPMLIVIEEIDQLLCHGYHDTPVKLLSVLDGLRQLNGGTVYVATTNYIERLQDHFKNRPGRFDLKRKINLPTDEARLFFFQSKMNLEEQKKYDLRRWVTDTKGLSLAHLKELIIGVVFMNQDYEKTLASLKSMSKKESSKDDNEDLKRIGF